MPKYLVRASFTAEGARGLLTEGGTARRDVVKAAVEKLGGTLEAFYFAFGADDVIGIADLPDHATAAAFALEISSSGRVKISTTVLLSPEEVDQVRGRKSGWRAPGA